MSQSGSHIPQEKIEEVRLAADIVEVVGQRVRLTKKGRDYWGLCPFHGDSDPSFKVDRQRGTWYCFGCQEGGSIFNFLMKDQGLSFPEAVRELAERAGIKLPKPELSGEERKRQAERDRILAALALAGEFYKSQLASAAGKMGRDYLFNRRGLDKEIVATFGLGYAPADWEGLRRHLLGRKVDEAVAIKAGLLVTRRQGQGCYDRFRDRVIFPIKDASGRLVSFGGRLMGPGEPKYLNGPESLVFKKSANLYNLDLARAAMRKKDRAVVVEGYFDVIACHQAGVDEAVAPMGTALTSLQARRLKGQAGEVVLVFDGDEAGRKAARRSLPVFLSEGVYPKVVLLPAGEDPDSLARKEGPARLEEELTRASSLIQAVLDGMVRGGDIATPEGRSKVVQEAGPVLAAIKDPITRMGYLEHLAREVAIPAEVVAARLGLALPGRAALRPKPAGGLMLSDERCLMELALGDPQAARVLTEGRALSELSDPDLRAVARAINLALERGWEPRPDMVSQCLEDQTLCGLVAGLAEEAPRLDPAEAKSQAEKCVREWRERAERRKLTVLKEQIDQAYKLGNHQEVDRLMRVRREYKSQPSSLNPGKD